MPSRAARKTNTIGIRQLKAELSRHLRRVEAGETIQVTDRGRVIATINPVAQPEEDHPAVQWARALVAAGKASWSGQRLKPPEHAARLRGTATVSDAVIEDRR
jgi:antitoxin (DNA-binding transcriptional repressor) of toxin-antitoxin stability system